MIKKRLFIANDSSFLSSGYGVYGKELLTRLHNTGKYQIAELGCYADHNDPNIKNIPWKFYPNAVNVDDPRSAEYKKSSANQFGGWRFNRCVLDFKPHIVFDVRDYWMSSYQEISPLRPYFHWILMPTVDSAPQKLEWLYTFCSADMVVPYTEWARLILSDSCGHKINLFPKIANAGINPEEFHPLDNRYSLKKQIFGSENASVIGTVMRNQKRKLFDDLMQAYRNYLNALIQSGNEELYNNSYLYLHTSYPEETGWDLPSLLYQHGLLDKTFFTYNCRQCKQYFASKYQNTLIKCKHCNNISATLSSVVNGVNNKQLNEIYNLFDLYIQLAICEGFGMPQIEAASCGVPIMSVDYSAMTEIVKNLDGFAIPVLKLFREMETGAYRAYPDIDHLSKQIFNYLVDTSPEKQLEKRNITRNKCIQMYTWDNVAKVWEECFDSIDITKKLAWYMPNPNKCNHDNMSVSAKLNNKEFVEYICDNIINNKELMKTGYAQLLIKDLTCGLVCRNGSVSSFGHKEAINSLENQLKNKLILDQAVTSQAIQSEDFLNVKQ